VYGGTRDTERPQCTEGQQCRYCTDWQQCTAGIAVYGRYSTVYGRLQQCTAGLYNVGTVWTVYGRSVQRRCCTVSVRQGVQQGYRYCTVSVRQGVRQCTVQSVYGRVYGSVRYLTVPSIYLTVYLRLTLRYPVYTLRYTLG